MYKMFKNLTITIVLLVLNVVNVYGTHNRGGTIRYEHLSGFTYQITIITLTVADSPADRPELALHLGDGTIDTVPRVNGGGNGELLFNMTKLNEYVTVHEYSGNGEFILSIEDPNRNGGIINIPNSINVPFYIETMLRIDGTIEPNGSIVPLAPPSFNAFLTTPFVMNIPVIDPDGDILSFELVSCKGENGNDVNGYVIPSGISISAQSGEFVWNLPQMVGEFNFAIKINEWRNGIVIAYSIYDFQVDVGLGFGPGVFDISVPWPEDEFGNAAFTIDPNELLNFDLGYTSANADSVEMTVYAETVATSVTNALEFDSVMIEVDWLPSISDIRCAPYIIVFKASNFFEGEIFFQDTTLLVYVRDSNDPSMNANCSAQLEVGELSGNSEKLVSLFPNPSVDLTDIRIRSEKAELVSVLLIDQLGVVVREESLWKPVGETVVAWNLPHVSNGVYFVSVIFLDRRVMKKLVIAK